MKQNIDEKNNSDNELFFEPNKELIEELTKELKELSIKSEEENKHRLDTIEYLNIFSNYLKINIPLYIFLVAILFILLNIGSLETNYYQLNYFVQAFKISICILPLSFVLALFKCLKSKKISENYREFTKKLLIKISLLSFFSIGYLIINVFL